MYAKLETYCFISLLIFFKGAPYLGIGLHTCAWVCGADRERWRHGHSEQLQNAWAPQMRLVCEADRQIWLNVIRKACNKTERKKKSLVLLFPTFAHYYFFTFFLVFAFFNEESRFRTSEFGPGGNFGVPNPNFRSKMKRNDLQRRKNRKY